MKPTMKNFVLCQYESVGQFHCGSYDEKIKIVDAMYGRLTKEYCQVGNYTQDLKCYSNINTVKPLQEHCDGKAACVVFLEKSIFGDPCPSIEKYMQITYDCTK